MKSLVLVFGLMFISWNCQPTADHHTASSKPTDTTIKTSLFSVDSIQAIFQSLQINGTFVVKNLKTKETTIYNEARAQEYFIPASTFKIPNALIALEAQAVKNGTEVIPWDGKQQPFKTWNQDHTLRSALKYSCVWFYQELARRVGEPRMREYLELMNYGNGDLSAGIDLFWLTGNFKITALEQLAFIEKFHQEEFPFSPRNYKIVKEALIVEKTDDYVLRAKTGWSGPSISPQIAWYVGYLKNAENTFIFAMNLAPKTNQDLKARQAITKRVFQSAGLIPEG